MVLYIGLSEGRLHSVPGPWKPETMLLLIMEHADFCSAQERQDISYSHYTRQKNCIPFLAMAKVNKKRLAVTAKVKNKQLAVTAKVKKEQLAVTAKVAKKKNLAVAKSEEKKVEAKAEKTVEKKADAWIRGNSDTVKLGEEVFVSHAQAFGLCLKSCAHQYGNSGCQKVQQGFKACLHDRSALSPSMTRSFHLLEIQIAVSMPSACTKKYLARRKRTPMLF